jgi:hypothetical protein
MSVSIPLRDFPAPVRILCLLASGYQQPCRLAAPELKAMNPPEFTLTADALDEIRVATADGEKELRWFGNDILDRDGALVARTRKQVYVRRKPTG